MYALAYDVKHILTAVMKNASSSPYGVSVAAVTGLTKTLRKRNRNTSPLREYGRLLKAMDVEVNRVGDKYNLGVTFNKVKEMSGSQRKTIHGNKVAKLIERGFTITVTKKMQNYFKWQADELAKGSGLAAKGKGNLKNFAKALSARGDAFGYLSTLRPGSTTRVPGRPFVQPSIKAGIESWKKRYWQTGVASRLFAQAWLRGHIRAPQYTKGM